MTKNHPNSTGFTLQCFHALKCFVGQLTAAASANATALLWTRDSLSEIQGEDPWAELAARYNLKVNGIQAPSVFKTAARLNVVSLYTSFDLFLISLPDEWKNLSGRAWENRAKDSKVESSIFDELKLNAISKLLTTRSQEIGIDYYRKVRHAIVHPSDKAKESARISFAKHEVVLQELGNSYQVPGTPHALDDIDFRDARLLSQLIIDTARLVALGFDPGDDALGRAIPDKFKHERIDARDKPGRQRNRLKAYLRTAYGLTEERADRVVSSLIGAR